MSRGTPERPEEMASVFKASGEEGELCLAETLAKFELVVYQEDAPSAEDAPPELDEDILGQGHRLRLAYTPPPQMSALYSVLGAEHVDMYNDIFGFLFALKRTQWQLAQCWLGHRSRYAFKGSEFGHEPSATSRNSRRGSITLGSGVQCDSGVSHRAWLLRAALQAFLDNLLWYVQVDVIEVQWRALLKELLEHEDYHAALAQHAARLHAIHGQCFLRVRGMTTAVRRILDVAAVFARRVLDGDVEQALDEAESVRDPSLASS